jgi:hypothetical protein
MEITEMSHNLQLSSREGKATSASTLEDHVEHPGKVSLPEKEILLGRMSTSSSKGIDFLPPTTTTEVPGPSTSTSADNDLPPNITTDNSTGGSDFDTTQALESWQTQLQHLYTLLDNFQFEFNFNLAKLRVGIPFPSQLSNETDCQTPGQSFNVLARRGQAIQESSGIALRQLRSDLAPATAVALAVNSHHIPAEKNDDSCDEDNEYDDAVVQPLPSNSLMEFAEPSSSTDPFEPSGPDSSSRGEQGPGSLPASCSCSFSSSPSASSESASLGSRPGLSRVSSFSASTFLNREDLFEPTLDDDDHDRAAISDDEARMDSLAVPGASAA